MTIKPNIMLTVGRVIGSLAGIFWVLILILSGLSENEPVTLEGLLLFTLVIGASVGVGISYHRPTSGARVTLLFAIALGFFASFTAGHNHWLAVLIAAGPFVLSGILILRSKEKMGAKSD